MTDWDQLRWTTESTTWLSGRCQEVAGFPYQLVPYFFSVLCILIIVPQATTSSHLAISFYSQRIASLCVQSRRWKTSSTQCTGLWEMLTAMIPWYFTVSGLSGRACHSSIEKSVDSGHCGHIEDYSDGMWRKYNIIGLRVYHAFSHLSSRLGGIWLYHEQCVFSASTNYGLFM